MKTLSTRQALREARRRWGSNALVGCYPVRPLPHRCAVGRSMLGLFFEVLGEGPTFEAAFADVDERKRKEDERIATLRAKMIAEGKLQP